MYKKADNGVCKQQSNSLHAKEKAEVIEGREQTVETTQLKKPEKIETLTCA